MNRQDFLTEFFRALGPMSEAEREQIADYYHELICDRLEQGMTEEEAVAEMGDPAEAAAGFREQYAAEENAPAPERKLVAVEDVPGLQVLDFGVENLRIIVQGIADEAELPSIRFDADPEVDDIRSETRDGVFCYRHRLRKSTGLPLLRFFKSPELRDFVIRIPASWKGTLLLKTCNGPISVSGVEDMQKLSMTTSNGRLELRDLSASRIEAKSGNAQIIMQNIGTIHLEAVTSNGKMEADGIRGDELFLHTTNGSVKLRDLQADGIRAETSNGKIEAQNCAASGALRLSSTNGAVTLENAAASAICLISSNARLTVERIKAPQIELRSSNGGISGTVLGKAEDYETEARTSNSSCNLPNLSGTGRPKRLSAVTSNARIQIEFCPVGE